MVSLNEIGGVASLHYGVGVALAIADAMTTRPESRFKRSNWLMNRSTWKVQYTALLGFELVTSTAHFYGNDVYQELFKSPFEAVAAVAGVKTVQVISNQYQSHQAHKKAKAAKKAMEQAAQKHGLPVDEYRSLLETQAAGQEATDEVRTLLNMYHAAEQAEQKAYARSERVRSWIPHLPSRKPKPTEAEKKAAAVSSLDEVLRRDH